jgi:hypothetical protein
LLLELTLVAVAPAPSWGRLPWWRWWRPRRRRHRRPLSRHEAWPEETIRAGVCSAIESKFKWNTKQTVIWPNWKIFWLGHTYVPTIEFLCRTTEKKTFCVKRPLNKNARRFLIDCSSLL